MRVSNINLATIAYYACFVIHLCDMKRGGTQRWKCCSASVRPFAQCDFSFFLFCGTLFKTLIIYRTDCCFILCHSWRLLFGLKNFLLSFDMGLSLWKVCVSCTFSFFHHQQYLWSGWKRLQLSPIWQLAGCIPLHKTLQTKFKNRQEKNTTLIWTWACFSVSQQSRRICSG